MSIIALLFTVIFKTLPDGKVALKDALRGASFTAILFMIGKFAIGAYLVYLILAALTGSRLHCNNSIVSLLSAIILYFGAEFTKVYATHYGSSIVPNQYAVYIRKKKKWMRQTMTVSFIIKHYLFNSRRN